MRCQASPALHNLQELFLSAGPRCLTCLLGRVGSGAEKGRGEEEEEKKEDKRGIGRGVRTGERQRKINKRKAEKN